MYINPTWWYANAPCNDDNPTNYYGRLPPTTNIFNYGHIGIPQQEIIIHMTKKFYNVFIDPTTQTTNKT
jgi:hypothetical protein